MVFIFSVWCGVVWFVVWWFVVFGVVSIFKQCDSAHDHAIKHHVCVD